MRILGIETSCDETAAAVYEVDSNSVGLNNAGSHRLLSNELHSQLIHQQFGGVVPELASRSHLEKIGAIIKQALTRANVSLADITHIAVTTKPGLGGSLLIGVCFAKALAYAQNIPLIGVDHLEGHAFSPLIEHEVALPHLALTASGGHTNIMRVTGLGEYELLGSTIDDAAGEAFDKVAKMLGLAYPGGPLIEKLAATQQFVDYYHYPRGENTTYNFSFSGLKTAVLYDLANRGWYDLATKQFLAKSGADEEKARVASSLLVCISEIFKRKIEFALQHNSIEAVTFAGGVACNKYIKAQLSNFCTERSLPFYTPSPILCTDNGAMIAFVGAYKAQQGKFDNLSLDIY
jgi:N6-L-threonylcarbamoyladenine synthase